MPPLFYLCFSWGMELKSFLWITCCDLDRSIPCSDRYNLYIGLFTFWHWMVVDPFFNIGYWMMINKSNSIKVIVFLGIRCRFLRATEWGMITWITITKHTQYHWLLLSGLIETKRTLSHCAYITRGHDFDGCDVGLVVVWRVGGLWFSRWWRRLYSLLSAVLCLNICRATLLIVVVDRVYKMESDTNVS